MPAAVSRSIPALVAAAGLPADTLSASIISFARFFSLPIKPELLAAIRRQALSPVTPQPDATKLAAAENAPDLGTAAKSRQALALAAAAAESKGVELHPKGLEGFAEAIDPDWQKRQNSGGGHQHERRNKGRDEQEKKNAPQEGISASGLKETALAFAEKDPLLAILNRLPGKNGQRWIVLPFQFCEHGREFRVSLRILLETDENQASNRAAGIAMDITEAQQQRLFVLTAENGRVCRLAVYLQPELPPKALASLVRELSQALEIPPERISVKNRKNFSEGPEFFPGESGYKDDLLRPINEAV